MKDQVNEEVINQIVDVLNWLRDNNKIDSNEQSILKEYYSKNHNDIDAIKDELLSFNESHEAVVNKIDKINENTIDNSPSTIVEKEEINKPIKSNLVETNQTESLTVNKELLNESKTQVDNSIVSTETVQKENKSIPVDLNRKEEFSNPVNDFSNPIGVQDEEPSKTVVSVLDDDKYIVVTYSDDTIKTFLNTLGFPGKALFIKLNEKYTDINTITDMFERIIKDCSLISETKDTSGNEKGNRLSLVNGPGYKLYDYSDKKLYDYDSKNGKINILFFVFLMGLSLGMVAMIVLNYLKR